MSDSFRIEEKEILSPKCVIHNQAAIFVNPDKNDKQKPVLCADCFTNLKKVQDQMKENEQTFSKIKNNNKNNVGALNKFLSSIKNFKDQINQSIDKVVLLIEHQVQAIISQQVKYNEVFQQSPVNSIHIIQQEDKGFRQQYQNIDQKVLEQLQNIKSNFNLEILINNWALNIIQQKDFISEKIYEYRLISKSKKLKEICQAISINPPKSILIAGSNCKIKVFEIKNFQLQQLQLLDGHQATLTFLRFFRKSEKFISGCSEGRIIIWKFNSLKEWATEQILNVHRDVIQSIQLNNDEDQFISSSQDKSIKFWKYQQNKWNCTQSIQYTVGIHSLTLSNSDNKLIAHIYKSKELQIIEKIDSQWKITQIIKLSNFGVRIQFINDNQFAVQLFASSELQIFNFDLSEKIFKQGQTIQVKCGEEDYTLFPMQYIQKKEIIIAKNCQYLNIAQRNQNGEFILSQTIDFQGRTLYGCGSEDGELLFTWDKISQEIQIRKLVNIA